MENKLKIGREIHRQSMGKKIIYEWDERKP